MVALKSLQEPRAPSVIASSLELLRAFLIRDLLFPFKVKKCASLASSLLGFSPKYLGMKAVPDLMLMYQPPHVPPGP